MKPRRAGARRTRRDLAPAQSRPAGGILSMLAILIPAAAVVSVGVAIMLVLDLRPGAGREGDVGPAPVVAENPDVALPQYVMAAPANTQEAYRYALENPEALQFIPCYCGCGGHSGHKSVHDCFLKQVGANLVEFEEHGSSCDVCVNIVLDVKEQLEEGKSLSEVRSYIDERYASIAAGTDTPLPPE